MNATRQAVVSRMSYDRAPPQPGTRDLAVEAPVALEYNGIAYAVMLATPLCLEEFAVGFTLSEGLVGHRDDILSVHQAEAAGGRLLRIELAPERAEAIRERVRLRLVEGSCGLCGLESIEQVLRPLPPVTARLKVQREAIGGALSLLEAHQPLGRATGAMHAAAFCAPQGAILAAMEDIGRHNALDKLIGHLALQGIDPAGGFLLLTARCSYELVEKAALAGCPVLVTISAPSDLAVERAAAAGLTLVSLARADSALVLTDAQGRIV